ncbi:MAG: hypothetical protein BGO27_05685 [Alphaproteobacteria bacterium 33-17]|nr:MAG: hypothetical protein BGO27_05685 [Alphaproteobacteria bacterium 33-17]
MTVKLPVPGVKKIIAVAAGKGGVGKSTVSANIAAGLGKFGLKVGIADLDIFGPSVPTLLNIHDQPEAENNMLIPIEKYDIQTMSIGYLVDESKAAIWRGAMVTKTLFQLIRGVKWDVDVLVLDLPPGTGDVILSLGEGYKIDGFVIVATPQKLALKDVQKAISACRKLEQPIVGIVENMSGLVVNNEKMEIFGKNELTNFVNENELDILGSLTIDPLLAKSCDEGLPYVLSNNYNTDNMLEIKKICEKIVDFLRVAG